MNYPFLYQTLDHLDLLKLRQEIQKTGEKTQVWDDWYLEVISCPFLTNYIANHFPQLKIYKSKLYLSQGKTSNYHIDRFHFHHLLHRILIPLQENYHYEWIINEQKHSYKPKAGEVLLFNNMVPHRFVSETNEQREVIYFDLIDPQVRPFMPHFQGNYSLENGKLADQYSEE